MQSRISPHCLKTPRFPHYTPSGVFPVNLALAWGELMLWEKESLCWPWVHPFSQITSCWVWQRDCVNSWEWFCFTRSFLNHWRVPFVPRFRETSVKHLVDRDGVLWPAQLDDFLPLFLPSQWLWRAVWPGFCWLLGLCVVKRWYLRLWAYHYPLN